MSEKTTTVAEQLRAIESGSAAGNSIGRAGRTHDALFGMSVGVLIAAMLAVVVYVYPTHVPWLIAISTLLYGVGIGIASALYRHRRNGTSRVTGRRHRIGFFITISLYGIGVVASVFGLSLANAIWIPYIAATALPLVIASSLRVPQ